MATKYKLIGKKRIEPRPHLARKLTGDDNGNVFTVRKPCKYNFPDDAMRLTEDLVAIRLALQLLRSIDPVSITHSDTQEQRDFGSDMILSQVTLLRTWERYARRKLARQYLAQ